MMPLPDVSFLLMAEIMPELASVPELVQLRVQIGQAPGDDTSRPRREWVDPSLEDWSRCAALLQLVRFG
jgi:hypothetical protein